LYSCENIGENAIDFDIEFDMALNSLSVLIAVKKLLTHYRFWKSDIFTSLDMTSFARSHFYCHLVLVPIQRIASMNWFLLRGSFTPVCARFNLRQSERHGRPRRTTWHASVTTQSDVRR